MWASYAMYVRTKSLDVNRYAQVFSNGIFFAETYPMDTKVDAGNALKILIIYLGIPERLNIDDSKEQNASITDVMKICQSNDIQVTKTKPERPNHNSAEEVIQEVRVKWFISMISKRVPCRLWDYVLQWTIQVMQKSFT